ncbi:MAG: hypothetical protein ACLR8H_06305, partial [Clostridium sp.]
MKKVKKLLTIIILTTMTSTLVFQSEVGAAIISEKNQINTETETIGIETETVNKIDTENNKEKLEISSEKSENSTETKQITLSVGKSYEIKNIGTNDITLNWDEGTYDIIYYYSNGNIKSYSKNRSYSDINLGAGEKAKVTVKGNTPTQLYIAQDYSSNITTKEISAKAIKDVTLSVGKSYEIKNTGANDITLNWDEGTYDIIYYYSNGNIKSYSKNRSYSDINLGAGEKAKVTVKGNTPTQLYIAQDYSSNITTKEISAKAIKDVTLSVGKSYEIKNTGANDITLNWDEGTYDIIYYYSNGNIKSYSKNRSYSDINLGAGEKAKVTVKGNTPTQLYIAQDYSSNITTKEISAKAIKDVTLSVGKSYEIKNTGANDITLNWDEGTYDIIYYYSNGNIKSYSKNRSYSDINLGAGEKAKVTVKGNTPTQLYIAQDYSSNITTKEISAKAIKDVTLSVGKSYEIKNTGANDITLNWDEGTYDIIYYYSNGNIKSYSKNRSYSDINLGAGEKAKVTVKGNTPTQLYIAQDYSSNITSKEINTTALKYISIKSGKSCYLCNSANFSINLSYGTGRNNIVYYNEKGDIISTKEDVSYNTIEIKPKYKVKITTTSNEDAIYYFPNDYSKYITNSAENKLTISSFTANKTSPQAVKTAVTFTT